MSSLHASVERLPDLRTRVRWSTADQVTGSINITLMGDGQSPDTGVDLGEYSGGVADLDIDRLHPILVLTGAKDSVAVGQRRVPLPGATNLRDLGGYPTTSGARTRWGVLFRADTISVDEADASGQVPALGLQSVYDLRTDEERRRTTSIWETALPGVPVHVPVGHGLDGDTSFMARLQDGTLRSFTEDDLIHHYRRLVEQMAAQFAQIISAVSSPGATPSLFHCAAGKDRTGILAALFLEILGVSRHHISEDYGLTQVFRPHREQAFAPMLNPLGVDVAEIAPLFSSPPHVIEKTLDYLCVRFGSVGDYLVREGGMNPEVLRSLPDRLLEPAGRRDPSASPISQ